MSAQNVVEVPRRMLASINPVTGELMREYEQHSDEVIENKLQLASKTFREYRNVPFAKRAQMMICAAEIREKGKANFGRLMTQEMGKLVFRLRMTVSSAWVHACGSTMIRSARCSSMELRLDSLLSMAWLHLTRAFLLAESSSLVTGES